MKLKLIKKQLSSKTGMKLYEVIDELGNVISSRKSKRDYVACTQNCDTFFGRIDLIAKGEHNKYLKNDESLLWKLENDKEYIEEIRKTSINPDRPFFGRRNQPLTIEEFIIYLKECIANYKNIAYLEPINA